jgi:hypothetical protein
MILWMSHLTQLWFVAGVGVRSNSDQQQQESSSASSSQDQNSPTTAKDNDYDDYVRQVIEEDQQHYQYYDYYDTTSTTAEPIQGQQQQQQQQQMKNETKHNSTTTTTGKEETVMTKEERLKAEADRRAQELADKIAADRERKFQNDLSKMDEQQRKVALKQKRRDQKIAQHVLKAARHGDLYGVIGMKNWNIAIPPKQMTLPGGFHFHIPGLTIKSTTERDIKKQFRLRAIQVHPDKNRDGRAQEAFIAVEYAASILSDKKLRAVYDTERQRHNRERLAIQRQLVTTTVTSTLQVTKQIVKGVHIILGPFFTPVLIIGFIIL